MFTFNVNNPRKPETSIGGGDEFTPPQDTHQKIYTQYNPLKDLQLQNSKIYHLPTSVESLFEEQDRLKGRCFNDNLTFYTGTSLLCGGILGGVKGTFEGLKAAERGDSLKIRVNRVLNSGGSVGRKFGNRTGVWGLLYSSVGGGISQLRNEELDDFDMVLAGVGTGVLFCSFNGVKSALIGGVIGGVFVAGFLGGSHLAKRLGYAK